MSVIASLRKWSPLVLLAILTAPFLWFHFDTDLATGTPKLRWEPSHGLGFLKVVLPGFAIGAAIAYLASLWDRKPHKPFAARASHAILEKPWTVLAIALTLSVAGLFFSPKGLSMGTFVAIYMLLALGLNVTIGFTGLLVLGFSAFYSIGAYTLALLSQAIPGFPVWLALPAAFLAASLAGLLVGLPCLRLRGDYLAIVTLGFAEALREVLRNLPLTHGDKGFPIAMSSQFPAIGPVSAKQIAWMVAVSTLAAVCLGVHRLYHSRTGRTWIAIREDETAASMMGIPVVRQKLIAFAVSAGVGGLGGAIFAGCWGFVDPSTASFDQSVLVLAMVILGGIGSLPGSLLGAAVLYLVPTLLRDQIPAIADYRLFFFGSILVAMMLLRPQGLLGSPRHKLELEGKS
ncbi:MAG: branched-chain amino acid ABC transporter permease [Fibrobacterota bacterium]|nr:branched-chain amino acid ABC transporter permease [Fibrobacterota bacterium]QQS03671.1 MAG: branched-chain amino acid ABC transporter permease [Fibrobacterota bacterium]